MIINRTRTMNALIASVAIGSSALTVNAVQIHTGAAMEAFLDDSFILEDFEGVNLHGGSSWPTANPLDDSTIDSFFSIEPGVTYTSTGAISFFGAFLGGEDSVILRSENDLTLTFDVPQAGVGMIVLNPTNDTITFYNGTNTLGVISQPTNAFVGWSNTTVGITSVSITSSNASLVTIDDMMFGAAVNPSCPADLNFDGEINTADLGILIAAFGTSSPAGDANNDGIVDTADLGMIIAVFDSNCP